MLERLWSSGSSPALWLGFEAQPRATTFPPVESFDRSLNSSDGPIHFPQTPFQCPRSRTATLGPLILTKAWLYIEPSPCGGVRQAGDPVDSDPGARLPWPPPKIKRWSLARALSVSPHPGADGFVQGDLHPISPECWPFSPALPVTLAHPWLPPKHGWLLGMDRWGLSPRTTWRPLTLFGQPGSPSFATNWKFLPRRLDGTTAGP